MRPAFGVPVEEIQQGISHGVRKVNVDTDGRLAITAAVREAIASKPDKSRVECRRPGADANPYLALAALLVSATDGLRRAATPPEPVVGDAYVRDDLTALPGSLESALAAFRADEVLRVGLGERFSHYYAVSREWELSAWRDSVSDWERTRYERAV